MELEEIYTMLTSGLELMFEHSMALLARGEAPVPIAHLFLNDGKQEIMAFVDLKDNEDAAVSILKNKLVGAEYVGLLLRLDMKTANGDAVLISFQTPARSELFILYYSNNPVKFGKLESQPAPTSGPLHELFHVFPQS